MTTKHICPNCNNKTFYTTAHVTQTWKVDENGNFLKEISTDETTHGPDDNNEWICTNCGSVAIYNPPTTNSNTKVRE